MIVLALTEQEATATLAALGVFRRPRGRTQETIAAERVTVKLRQAVDHPETGVHHVGWDQHAERSGSVPVHVHPGDHLAPQAMRPYFEGPGE